MESLENSINQLKINKGDLQERFVKFSFYITYAFLMTTGTITFIESIRTKIPKIRHILNLETCISIIAAFFYGLFIKKISKAKIDYKEINVNRYIDWSITTPIMLLVLLLAFGYNLQKNIVLSTFLLVLVLNYGMLGFGFLGENKLMDKTVANIIGFIFFIAMYGLIYFVYIHNHKNNDNFVLFLVFFILWALYGVAYWLNEKNKNIGYNILDLFSKCFVGIFFWAYFAKVLVLKHK